MKCKKEEKYVLFEMLLNKKTGYQEDGGIVYYYKPCIFDDLEEARKVTFDYERFLKPHGIYRNYYVYLVRTEIIYTDLRDEEYLFYEEDLEMAGINLDTWTAIEASDGTMAFVNTDYQADIMSFLVN